MKSMLLNFFGDENLDFPKIKQLGSETGTYTKMFYLILLLSKKYSLTVC